MQKNNSTALPQSDIPSGSVDSYTLAMRRCNHAIALWRHKAEQYGYEDCGVPLTPPYSSRARHTLWSAIEQGQFSYPARVYAAVQCPFIQNQTNACGTWCEDWRFQTDIIGVASLLAEQELITMACDMLQGVGVPSSELVIILNDRMVLGRILQQYIGLDTVQLQLMMKLIDTRQRYTADVFNQKMYEIAESVSGGVERLQLISSSTSIQQLPAEVQSINGVSQLQQLAGMLSTATGCTVQFAAFMMQGLGRYMGTVFEVRKVSGEIVCTGGRYESFGTHVSQQSVPMTVTMLLDTAPLHLAESSSFNVPPAVDVAIVTLHESAMTHSIHVAQALRSEGVRVAVDIVNQRADQQIRAALKRHIPFILLVGEEDTIDGVYTLKATTHNTEERLSVERIITRVMDHRHSMREDDEFFVI